MPDNAGDKSPGYHNKRWYKKRGLPMPKPTNPQLRKSPSISNNASSPRVDTTLLVTIIFGVLALIGIVLQWNGVVTVQWKWSALIYVTLSGIAVYSFWMWEPAVKWRLAKRLVVTGIVGLLFAGISGVGVVTQYRREQANSTFDDPDFVASDAEKLPNVDLTKRPLIVGALGDLLSCRPGNGLTDNIYVMVSLTDKGIPTSLSGWRLNLELPGFQKEFIFQEIAENEKCVGGSEKPLTFKSKDAIYEKAEKLIPTGQMIRGWVKFTIPGELYPLVPEHAKMKILFADYQFHKYSMTFTPSTDTTPQIHYYPGIDDPTKQ